MLDLALYATSRKLQKTYNALLREKSGTGLTFTQYIVLRELWSAPAGSLAEKDLAIRLSLDSGTLTPVLKTLEKDGFVIRSRSKEDERVVLVALTDEGTSLEKKIGTLEVVLSAEKTAQLEALLGELDAALTD